MTIPKEDATRESKPVDDRGISRRDVIKGGAAIGALTLLAACAPETQTTTVVSTVTTTKTVATTVTPPTTTITLTTTETSIPPLEETYTFLNLSEAETVKAIFAQLIPGTPSDPGAVEAGAHIYLDRALSGFYSNQQTTYRRGLAAVEALSQSRYGDGFANLTDAQKIEILTAMQTGTAEGFVGPAAAAFFNLLNQHAREGTFCDPVYGGNYNLAGWRMVGFPGTQFAYSEQNMAIGADQTNLPLVSLADTMDIPVRVPDSGF